MATKVWIGNALAVAQVDTITIGGSWAASTDKVTITINNKDLQLSVGTDNSTANVATAIKEMINGETQTGTGDHVFSETGDNVGEFEPLTATVSGSVVTVTGVKGQPFTMTETVDVGSGTCVIATSTTATGPNHWDNADNWDAGTIPANTDDVIIDHRAKSSILYGLDQNAVNLTSLTITSGFQSPYEIGLPARNQDNSSLPYNEYRDTYLKIEVATVTIGEGSSAGSGRIKLDTLAGATAGASTIIMHDTGTAAETGVPAFLWKGTHASNALHAFAGDVGIAFFDEETATLTTLECVNATVVAGAGSALTTVNIGEGTGHLTLDDNCTTLEVEGGTCVCRGAGNFTTINVFSGGILDYRSTGTITTLTCSGTADFSNDPRGRTITNAVQLHRGAVVNDPGKTLTMSAGFKLNHCKPEDVSLDFGPDRTYSLTA